MQNNILYIILQAKQNYYQPSAPSYNSYPSASVQQQPKQSFQQPSWCQQPQQSSYYPNQSYQPPPPQQQQQPQKQQQQLQQQNYLTQPSPPVQNKYPSTQQFKNPDPTFLRESTPSYLPAQVNTQRRPSCTAAFAGGLAVDKDPSSGQWSHVNPAAPTKSGYIQPKYNQQPSYKTQNYSQPANQYQQQVPYIIIS